VVFECRGHEAVCVYDTDVLVLETLCDQIGSAVRNARFGRDAYQRATVELALKTDLRGRLTILAAVNDMLLPVSEKEVSADR
jgi:hypothetical protein